MPNTILETKPGGFRAGGIIIHEGKILLMHVIREGDKPEEFYILPGGHWEEGETLEETCVREIQEEFCITVTVKQLEFTVIGEKRVAFYFLCEYNGGEIKLGGPEKEEHDSDSPDNIFVEWIDLKDVPDLPMGPEATKKALIEYLNNTILSS